MPLKVDLQMSSCGQTWTESHYYLASNALPFPGSLLQQMASLRARCLGAEASVIGADISDVPSNRLVQPIAFDNGGYISKFEQNTPPDSGQAATPNNSILLTLTAGPALPSPPKKLYLASPPQGMITTFNNNRDELGSNPQFSTALGQYMAFLTGNVKPADLSTPPQNIWGYRARDGGNEVQVQSISAGVAPLFNVAITVAAPLPGIGTGPGQTMDVYLKGWRRTNPRERGLSGAFRIATITFAVPPATAPVTYTLFNTAGVLTTNFLTNGSICPLQFKYPPYGPYWDIEKAVTRKRGESVARRHGRSPSQR